MKSVRIVRGGCLALAMLGTWAQAAIVIQPGAENTQTNAGITVPPPKGGESNASDTLEFLNGDVLHGEFLSIDAKTGARWQHPAMKEPLNVDLSSIARIKLDRPKEAANSNATQNCNVRLTNKDQFTGQLVSMDDTNMVLNTWYGGTLNIARKMIDSITPGQSKSGVIYEGPTGIQGWTVRNGPVMVRPGGVVARAGEAWTYNDGAFLSSGNGPIGRPFEFPPMANIEFDLAWTGYLQLCINLFSDTLENFGGNSYMLVLSQGTVYLQRVSRAGDSSMLGNTEVPPLARKNHAHVSLRVNQEQKTIALLVDGSLIKQWNDPATFIKGPNLVFYQQGQARTKVSGIKVSSWDGKFDTPEAAGQKTKEDLVNLSNHDKISGTLKGIQNGKMIFQTAFATLEVPLERVAQIELAGEKAERPAEAPGEVRLTFKDHGSMSFRLDQWNEREITGVSPALGQVKLNPSAFSEVQLNPGQKKAENEDAAMGAPGADDVIEEKD